MVQNVNGAKAEEPCSQLTEKAESWMMEGGLQVVKHLPSCGRLLLYCKVSQMNNRTQSPASWRITINHFPYHMFSVASFLLVSTMNQSEKAFLDFWKSKDAALYSRERACFIPSNCLVFLSRGKNSEKELGGHAVQQGFPP